jgi:tetratricopeptide (TPR) repeat protein
MMHRFFLRLLALTTLLLLAAAQPAKAMTLEEANALLEEAHLLFERGEAKRATELYVQVATGGFSSAKVWANAGTAAYRAGDVGRAVLYYNRALRIDPTDDRALRSLEFISPASNDSTEGLAFLRSTIGRVNPGWWVLGAQAVFIVICIGLAKALAHWRNHDVRTHWIIVSSWSLLLLGVLGGLAWLSHQQRTGGGDAVVVREQAIARSAPTADATAQLELPAGTIIRMTEAPIRGFVRIQLRDGQSGFLPVTDIEAI